jgi:hypothetical protein
MAHRHEVKRTVANIEKFLRRLEEGFSVSGAAHSAGFHRATAYTWRDADPAFAAAWDSAAEAGSDALEDEARRRAADGIRKLILHQGKPVLIPSRGYDAEGKPLGRLVPLYEHKYSDTLLMYLLNGRRPEKFKYRPEPADADGPPPANLPSDAPPSLDPLEIARRIAFLLTTGAQKLSTDNEG